MHCLVLRPTSKSIAMKIDILAKSRKLMHKEASAGSSIGEATAKAGWPLYHKIGTGLGVSGLTLSGATLVDSRRNVKMEEQRKLIEQKSLTALRKIHEALSIKPTTEVDIIKNPTHVKTTGH